VVKLFDKTTAEITIDFLAGILSMHTDVFKLTPDRKQVGRLDLLEARACR